MQLNDILEENSVKAIALKTKISEDNLDNLLAKNFEALKKVKTLGFISIIEREFKADLSTLRNEASEYYAQFSEDKSVTLGFPILEEKKGTSKLFLFFILSMMGFATWYFLTQFDKKNFSKYIPFVDESTIGSFIGDNKEQSKVENELSIPKVSKISEEEIPKEATPKENEASDVLQTQTITDDESVIVAQSVTDITPVEGENLENSAGDVGNIQEESVKRVISIVPVNRLWFGLIDMDTQQRDHFSISDVYELDISSKSWLIATSSAPFSLRIGDKGEEFNDAKEHYFKIDKNGVTSLDKDEYVALGGWAQW